MSFIKTITKKQIVYAILIVIWMAVVFAFSNQVAEKSSKTSGGITEEIVKIIVKEPEKRTPQVIDMVETIVRKLAHFSIYTVGGFLMAGLVNTTNQTNKKLILYAVLFTVIYACTDEIHQIFVDGRSGELRDVLIDTSGATLGTMIFLAIRKIGNNIMRNLNHKKVK